MHGHCYLGVLYGTSGNDVMIRGYLGKAAPQLQTPNIKHILSLTGYSQIGQLTSRIVRSSHINLIKEVKRGWV